MQCQYNCIFQLILTITEEQMNSLIEDRDQLPNNNVERQRNSLTQSKYLSKPYSFFIFYKILTTTDQKLTNLEKLSFRLRENIPKQQSDKYADSDPKDDKLVNLFFTHIDDENEIDNCLIELKYHIVENKTKLIILGFESDLLKILHKASQHAIDITPIPFAIYSPQFNNDLAMFLGWNSESLQCLAEKSSNQLSTLARQWITSPSEKIDLWEVVIKVQQEGHIQQLQYDKETKAYKLKQHEQIRQKKVQFLSNMTIGHHSRTFIELSSQHKPTTQPPSILTRWRYNLSGMSKFCCLGTNTLRTSTGIINISFSDDTNNEVQLMRQFVDDEQQLDRVTKKHGNKKKVLSVALSNVPLYNGERVSVSRVNDNKIELLVFDAKKSYHNIGSVAGVIRFRFETEREVYIKVGDACFVVQRPLDVMVRQKGKMKALVNKETVGC